MGIINDMIREDTESFFLDLTTPVMLDRVNINPAVAEVIINDDDRESSSDVFPQHIVYVHCFECDISSLLYRSPS